MATYKVLQDIEAEDKLLGPLTLKQFIFAIITICLLFLTFFIAQANILLAIPWLVPIAFFGFMATPIGRDQPNDVWLAARIRFLIKPRKRTWNQSGMEELVTINVPKKVEIQRSDGLSQTEVKSRLSALSSLMDTRGWAVKNSDTAPNMAYSYAGAMPQYGDDRLIDLSAFAPEIPTIDAKPSDDMLDPLNNMIAQRIDTAIKKQQSDKIESLKNNMRSGALAEGAPERQKTNIDYSFIDRQPVAIEPGYTTFGARIVTPGSKEHTSRAGTLGEDTQLDPEEDKVLQKIHKTKEIEKEIEKSSHEHRIKPISEQAQEKEKEPQNKNSNSQAPDVIIKELGQANDISVASIANLAKHAEQEKDLSNNDIVSLH